MVPEHVRAVAAFIAAIYPGQGVEQNLTSDHIERFNAGDYQRVWEVLCLPWPAQSCTGATMSFDRLGEALAGSTLLTLSAWRRGLPRGSSS